MKYLTLRWFTLNYFDERKLKLFHSLEQAIKKASEKNKNLSWQEQTKNYLKQEFKNLIMTKTNNNLQLMQFKKFENNLKNFFKQNNLTPTIFLNDLDFIQKCDDIIYHQTRTHKNASIKITSLP